MKLTSNEIVKIISLLGILQLFNEKNGTLPGRIIYYRDGVGEGQLGQVKAIELASIQVIERYGLFNLFLGRYTVIGFCILGQDTLDSVYKAAGKPFPKFTFVIVSKRINTRFYKPFGKDHRGQPNYVNPDPGTVVDGTFVNLKKNFIFF
jgi:hypothetical protein